MLKQKEKFFYNYFDCLYTNLNSSKTIYKSLYLESNNDSLYTFKRVSSKYIKKYLYLYIQASKRSTRISIVNSSGSVLFTLTVGMLKYFKSQRKGPFVAQQLFKFFLKHLNKLKLNNIGFIVCLKGNGPGRRPI